MARQAVQDTLQEPQPARQQSEAHGRVSGRLTQAPAADTCALSKMAKVHKQLELADQPSPAHLSLERHERLPQ
jgi:hypothetical protein